MKANRADSFIKFIVFAVWASRRVNRAKSGSETSVYQNFVNANTGITPSSILSTLFSILYTLYFLLYTFSSILISPSIPYTLNFILKISPQGKEKWQFVCLNERMVINLHRHKHFKNDMYGSLINKNYWWRIGRDYRWQWFVTGIQ